MLIIVCKRASFCHYFSLHLKKQSRYWLLKVIFILSDCLFINSKLNNVQLYLHQDNHTCSKRQREAQKTNHKQLNK